MGNWRDVCLPAVLTISLVAPAGAATTVVAQGLRNPRGLAVGPEGAVYVAEAGRGGAGPCVVNPELGNRCLGQTGAVTRIDLAKGTQERLVDGLPSIAVASGFQAQGPNDVSLQGRGGAFVTIGLGGAPSAREAYGPGGAALGSLIKVSASGEWKVAADIAGYEAAANPDGNQLDTNAFGTLALPSGRLVADAGGNALLWNSASGGVSTVYVFPRLSISNPPFSVEPVPTSIAQAPNGDIYVGLLSGGPFTPGAARIYRFPAGGGPPEVLPYGFFTIVGIAFGPDGSLYVAEIFAGMVERIAPDGTRSTVAAGLPTPGGVAVGSDGTVYVSVNAVHPTNGMVLAITE